MANSKHITERTGLMSGRLAPLSEHVYTVLRIVAGAMFMFHGVQKIFGVLLAQQPAVGSQLWFGGLLELVCGTAIALGLFTRWAAFIASGMMAVAYIQFHWKLSFGAAFFPAINQGELALLYSFVFLYMATKGNRIWGLRDRRVTPIRQV